jgi:hypothetical protein
MSISIHLLICCYCCNCVVGQAAEQVRHYIDKLLEEVDEAGAGALRAAEAEVTHREGSLKAMRAEVSMSALWCVAVLVVWL